MDGGDKLAQHRGALLIISHDRAFLRNSAPVSSGFIMAKLRRRDGHFDEFESWSDGILAEEAVTRHKMDRRIASEPNGRVKAFRRGASESGTTARTCGLALNGKGRWPHPACHAHGNRS